MKVKAIDNILNLEMDRKDFLSYLGVTALALTGVSSAIKVITRSPRVSYAPSGFGAGAYGGNKKG